jgi:FkbM family methyltransferase
MILDWAELMRKYSLKIKGVIHIGAHIGTEHKLYIASGIKNIMYFEPDPETFKLLTTVVRNNALCYNVALGNKKGLINFNVASNGGASSSILKPKKHLTRHPNVKFEDSKKVLINKLDNILFNASLYNFINIDVQGYELEVFKGAKNTLQYIDYIMAEVNRDEVYENCAQVQQIDSFLAIFGFERVETNWAGGIWGDAFYMKKL